MFLIKLMKTMSFTLFIIILATGVRADISDKTINAQLLDYAKQGDEARVKMLLEKGDAAGVLHDAAARGVPQRPAGLRHGQPSGVHHGAARLDPRDPAPYAEPSPVLGEEQEVVHLDVLFVGEVGLPLVRVQESERCHLLPTLHDDWLVSTG